MSRLDTNGKLIRVAMPGLALFCRLHLHSLFLLRWHKCKHGLSAKLLLLLWQGCRRSRITTHATHGRSLCFPVSRIVLPAGELEKIHEFEAVYPRCCTRGQRGSRDTFFLNRKVFLRCTSALARFITRVRAEHDGRTV